MVVSDSLGVVGTIFGGGADTRLLRSAEMGENREWWQ